MPTERITRRDTALSGPSLIFIMSDLIRGHISQSRGLSGWLSRFTGADVVEMDVPAIEGKRRVELLKIKGRRLPAMKSLDLLAWLDETGGAPLFETARRELASRGLSGDGALFVAAGSSAAPFALALSRIVRGRSCVLMTPSAIPPSSFDFAVVPWHDHPRPELNVLTTLGAPNAIFPDELERRGWELAELYPPFEGSKGTWGLMIGGDDVNYEISAEWVSFNLPPVLAAAESMGIDLYITTSRRTSAAACEVLELLVPLYSSVRMLLIASKDEFNPVPGMLGLCSRLFVTDDSVSMVSEAITAGREVFLMRAGRRGGARTVLQDATAWLARRGLLPGRLLWGKPRFDALFDLLKRRGLLNEMSGRALRRPMDEGSSPHADGPALNEARRAAEWILERWDSERGRE
ncbi:MAG: ELM1/GtrOC1 family putative glycosyltransferase [Synergistota bacterium]|nr:ELM1/GtrOC1 family putative glycosyltransferase [Synergistota bacterium]